MKEGGKEEGKERRKKEGNLTFVSEETFEQFYDDDALFSFNFQLETA